jgi:hypothetical protein
MKLHENTSKNDANTHENTTEKPNNEIQYNSPIPKKNPNPTRAIGCLILIPFFSHRKQYIKNAHTTQYNREKKKQGSASETSRKEEKKSRH